MARCILLLLAACALPGVAAAGTATPVKPPEVVTQLPLDLTRMSPEQVAKWSQVPAVHTAAPAPAASAEKGRVSTATLTRGPSGLDRTELPARLRAKRAAAPAYGHATPASGAVPMLKPVPPRAASVAPAAPLTPAERAKLERSRDASAKGGAR